MAKIVKNDDFLTIFVKIVKNDDFGIFVILPFLCF